MLPQNKRVCLKFSKATCSKRNAVWDGRELVLQRGEKRGWEMEGGGGRFQGYGLFWATFCAPLTPNPDPRALWAVPRPCPRPSLAQKPRETCPSLSCTPASPGFILQCPLLPSPQASAPCFGTLLSRVPTQLPHLAPTSHPQCPLFPVWSTREICGRRLSGHWEERAEEAAGASWWKGVP